MPHSSPTNRNAATSTTGAPASTPPPSTLPSGTVIRYAAPVVTGGFASPALAVSDLGSGSCNPGSDVITGVSVYRCFAGNLVIDPCWATTSADATSSSGLCMQAPWSTSGEKVEASGLTAGTARSKLNLDDPWAVQLTSGQRCLAAQGAHEKYQGSPLNYGCASSGGSPAITLLGSPDRTTAYWTFKSVALSGTQMVPGPTATVAVAWFAGPPPVRPCAASQLKLALNGGSGEAGHIPNVILLRNTSSAPCSLFGYPGVAALDASGHQVAQAQRTLRGAIGGFPGDRADLPTVDLAPGQAASSMVEGTDVPPGSATSCPYYPALLVTPPGTTVSTRLAVTAPLPQGFPGCSPIQVHPVLPGTTGTIR